MEPYDFYEFIKEDFSSSLSQPTGIKQPNQQPTGMKPFNQPPPLTPKAKEQARIDNLRNMTAKYRQPLTGMQHTPIQLAAWGQKEASPEEAEEMMLCPFFSKYFKNFSLNSCPVMFISNYFLNLSKNQSLYL